MASELAQAYAKRKRLYRDENGQLHVDLSDRGPIDYPEWVPYDDQLEGAANWISNTSVARGARSLGRMGAKAARDTGVGLAKTATGLAGKEEWGDAIGRNVPQVQTNGEMEDLGAVLGQYVIPGMGLAKVATKAIPAIRSAPTAVKAGAAALGWGLADAAVTDPDVESNQPFSYDPEASDLENKARMGLETAALIGGGSALYHGGKAAIKGGRGAFKARYGEAPSWIPTERAKVPDNLVEAVKGMEVRAFRNSQASEGANYARAGRGVDAKPWHKLRNAQRQKLAEEHVTYLKANHGVTDDELQAVKTFFGYGEVARGKGNIGLVESFIDKTPASPGRAYRHTTGSKNSAIWNLKPGDTHSFGDVTSSSLRPDIASAKAGRTFGKHRFVIDHKTGRDVSKLGLIDEYEVLIPRGTKFKVKSVADEDGIRTIHLEEI